MRTSLALLLALLALAQGCTVPQAPGVGFSVSDYGVLSYPSNRGGVDYTKGLSESGTGYNSYRISYASAGNLTIYGLLREVGNEKASIVLLPGAGRTKEQEQELAAVLAEMGYTTLSLDQRGEGESIARAETFDQQYARFLRGGEVFEYQRVYDALRAYDLLVQLGAEKVLFMGESMGGRYAIMAAALEPDSLGALGIATSGYGFGQMADANSTRFARSIDPDTYVGLIAPRKLVMLHSPSDPVIPLSAARSTFLKAHEPRSFVEVDCTDAQGNGLHGWCEDMNEMLEGELEKMVG